MAMNVDSRRDLGTRWVGDSAFVWGKRTYVMGVINLTDDSFSGDGLGYDVGAAEQMAIEFERQGADIIDVGGESTRPRHTYGKEAALEISPKEETRRVLPVIRRLSRSLTVPISIDTYKASVAERALAEGAAMVNDVWGLQADPRMAEVVSKNDVPVILVHNQGHTQYGDLVSEIIGRLEQRMEFALAHGIEEDQIIVDPGIGFGKNARQNLEVLRRLGDFRALGRPILVGTSRKSTIGTVLDLSIDERLEGTAATVAVSIANGADVVRVHDVKEMVRVARMTDAIVRGWDGG